MQELDWTGQGNSQVFQRSMLLVSLLGALPVVAAVAFSMWADPASARSMAPLGLAMLLLIGLGGHSYARKRARRADVEASFASLAVLHHGVRYHVTASPMLGEYGTRRAASEAAMQRGGWAVVVRAWDRYYLLAVSPPPAVSTPRVGAAEPVSFRSRAVTNVVPAIHDDVAAIGA